MITLNVNKILEFYLTNLSTNVTMKPNLLRRSKYISLKCTLFQSDNDLGFAKFK